MPRSYADIKAGIPTEIKNIARDIVEKSKRTAHVDTGRLRRSISYVIDLQGVITFTEVFYGQFLDNSDLEENIKSMMPAGVAWKLIYTDDNGQPYQVVRSSASGRTSTTNATKATSRRSLGIAGIKNFLKALGNGEKKNETADNERQDN
jgi:hypothetical protein